MATMPRIHVYCGPTISFTEAASMVPGATIHPPVRHGDVLSIDAAAGDTVVIIDGIFFQAAAVRHKELLELLTRGVNVVGASSMGALRAAELSHYGMIGIGAIFSKYAEGVIDADDEVAVAYDPSDYRQLSEALADMRDVVTRAVNDGAISQAEGISLTERACGLHFVSRSWAALRKEGAATRDEQSMEQLDRWRASTPALEGAKLRDAREALRLVADGTLPQPPAREWTATPWRTSFLRHWTARFQGQQSSGRPVPFLAIFQHQQLYDPGFPQRWRRRVLSWIAGSTETAELESQALAIAEAQGLTLGNLTDEQISRWLTDSEIATLDEAEKTARLLVRAVPQDATIPLTPVTSAEAADLIDPDLQSQEAVRSAFRYNDEIIGQDARVSVYDLRPDVIIHHLARSWNLNPEDRPALIAAARDRGFTSLNSAVEATRSFFLAQCDQRA
jgi:hypothetical protein